MTIAVRRLNYQHLLYFWAVVRAGTLSKACEELHLSAPTVSTQLRTLEQRIGHKLFVKSGRTLVPTKAGRIVFSYAEEIFAIGNDLLNALAHKPTERPLRFVVGIDDVLPKEIAQHLLQAALDSGQPTQLVCREGTLDRLLAALRLHEIDIVLSDSPVTPSVNDQAYNHLLGACGESWVATPELAKKLRKGFPKSLHGAPMLLPTADTAIRRSLDQWLDKLGVQPLIVGEFEDYALLREFARVGRGIAPIPDVLEQQFRQESGLVVVGTAPKVRAEFYAISLERKIKHPAVRAICEKARELFAS
jgi:LysR family transcriptional regulator, transcriptional activator of nhaA